MTADGESALPSPDGRRLVVSLTGRGLVLQSIDGGAAVPVANTTEADIPVRWTPDGRALLLYNRHQVPAQVERLDLATGRREAVRQLAPLDRSGLLSIDSVELTGDQSQYAYTYTRLLSTLFIVDGVR